MHACCCFSSFISIFCSLRPLYNHPRTEDRARYSFIPFPLSNSQRIKAMLPQIKPKRRPGFKPPVLTAPISAAVPAKASTATSRNAITQSGSKPASAAKRQEAETVADTAEPATDTQRPDVALPAPVSAPPTVPAGKHSCKMTERPAQQPKQQRAAWPTGRHLKNYGTFRADPTPTTAGQLGQHQAPAAQRTFVSAAEYVAGCNLQSTPAVTRVAESAAAAPPSQAVHSQPEAQRQPKPGQNLLAVQAAIRASQYCCQASLHTRTASRLCSPALLSSRAFSAPFLL